MLVRRLRRNDQLKIGEEITITVTKSTEANLKVAIDAPGDMTVTHVPEAEAVSEYGTK